MAALLAQLERHPEVDAVVRVLLGGVRGVLGARLVGVYLFGSLAAGGFDEDSDVDVLVVTEGPLAAEAFEGLRVMHARVAALPSRWATQLEVSYITRGALRRYDPADRVHPRLDRGRGETLRLKGHDSDWVVLRHAVRERGVVLEGPDPRVLIDPVSPGDLRRAMRELLWWPAEILADPSRIAARGYQSYIVLTMCRVLYTLRHGAVVSKREAAEWALGTLDARWAPLVGGAWEGRHAPDAAASREDVEATLGLIRHTLERAGAEDDEGDADARPSRRAAD